MIINSNSSLHVKLWKTINYKLSMQFNACCCIGMLDLPEESNFDDEN